MHRNCCKKKAKQGTGAWVAQGGAPLGGGLYRSDFGPHPTNHYGVHDVVAWMFDAASNPYLCGVTTATRGAAPPPNCSLSATPNAILAGGSSTLSLSCDQAISLIVWNDLGTVAAGDRVVSPAATTTYQAQGWNANGGSAWSAATVTVSAAPPPMPGCSLTGNFLNGNSNGNLGATLRLDWGVSDDADGLVNLNSNYAGTVCGIPNPQGASGTCSFVPSCANGQVQDFFVTGSNATGNCTATHRYTINSCAPPVEPPIPHPNGAITTCNTNMSQTIDTGMGRVTLQYDNQLYSLITQVFQYTWDGTFSRWIGPVTKIQENLSGARFETNCFVTDYFDQLPGQL